MSLCSGEEVRPTGHSAGNSISAEGREHIVVAYGLRRFLADIDTGRTYSRNNLIGSVLNDVAGQDFADTFEKYDFTYKSAREFRERHLIELLKGLSRG